MFQTREEWHAVYTALSQYVENAEESAVLAEEAGEAPDPVLAAGRSLLERMDAELASGAG